MAGNTGDNHRDSSVKDRIQVCDPVTKECTKYNTNTGEAMGTKEGPYKGVAMCDDDRSIDRTDNFVNKIVNS